MQGIQLVEQDVFLENHCLQNNDIKANSISKMYREVPTKLIDAKKLELSLNSKSSYSLDFQWVKNTLKVGFLWTLFPPSPYSVLIFDG